MARIPEDLHTGNDESYQSFGSWWWEHYRDWQKEILYELGLLREEDSEESPEAEAEEDLRDKEPRNP